MTDKPSVKGTLVILARRYIVEKFGDKGLQKVIEEINPRYKEILLGEILPSTWLPEACYVEILIAVDKLFGKGDYQECFELGHFAGSNSVPIRAKGYASYRVGVANVKFSRRCIPQRNVTIAAGRGYSLSIGAKGYIKHTVRMTCQRPA